MLRISILSIFVGFSAITLITPTANAANLVKSSKVTRSIEKGVTVYRGSAAPINTEIALAGRETSKTIIREKIIIQRNFGWPARHIRVQGFTNGRGAGTSPRRRVTNGFYADRIAAGY